MLEVSVSFRTSGKSTSISHNNREISDEKKYDEFHNHIDWTKTSENILLVKKSIREVYKENFSVALENYNSKQKRSDRKIDDYYLKVKNDGSLDLQREFIIQFGDKNFVENSTNAREIFAQKLVEYEKWFEKEFPDLKVYNAVVHMDEATPHLHLNVVPVADGYKQGMSQRPSFSKWLKNNDLDFTEFCQVQTEKLEDFLKQVGAERKKVGSHDYVKPNEYRKMMREAENVLERAKEQADEIIAKTRSEALKIDSEASEVQNQLNTSKNILERLESKIEPLRNETEILDLKLQKSKLELELFETTPEKFLKTEPNLKLFQVADIINKASSSFTGLKGITLDALKKIRDVVKQLFDTVELQRKYIRHLEIENKKLKDPERYLSLDERIKRAEKQQKELSGKSVNLDFSQNKNKGLYR
ncbi:plasmid recombination enzyme [Lactococcus hodotermopsidis]|uniref:Plasmid recombination enzyme n=1 Tax=Pseudolactococcus hodotermopsidis TaxID=2709157 RepID=A0A6A0BCZ5_9LACT|nr:plasmid recombination protein [Lactococcus hodotermopsidis]GFH43289.1 plasmid recombination enzyme [Lactococcus hodotermopsidis]